MHRTSLLVEAVYWHPQPQVRHGSPVYHQFRRRRKRKKERKNEKKPRFQSRQDLKISKTWSFSTNGIGFFLQQASFRLFSAMASRSFGAMLYSFSFRGRPKARITASSASPRSALPCSRSCCSKTLATTGSLYEKACARYIKASLKRSRPFIIISRSLSRETDAVERLSNALSQNAGQVAGVHKGMQPHTLFSEVLQISQVVIDSGADSIITVGGGSLVDGAKTIVFVSY